MEAEYTQAVELKVMVPIGELSRLQEELTEATNGAATFVHGKQSEFAVIDGKIVFF